jgi:hypothetical protein
MEATVLIYGATSAADPETPTIRAYVVKRTTNGGNIWETIKMRALWAILVELRWKT